MATSLISSKSKLIYKGDIYWGSSTWTAPCDGFAEVAVVPNETNYYLYITDTGVGGTWTHTLCGTNGNRLSICFPVTKGSVLSTAQQSGVASAIARFTELY